MTRTHKWLALTVMAGLLALAWPVAPAGAQAVRTQSGHALDANPSATGGSINSQVDQRYPTGGQYIITGQARAGRSFQGFIPYTATDQFSRPLGSSALYGFERDSIGLPMVRQAGAAIYTPQQYIGSSRTVFSASDVPRHAPATPGTTSVLNPFAQPAYQVPPSQRVAATTNYEPLASAMAAPNLPLSEQLALRREALLSEKPWNYQPRLPLPPLGSAAAENLPPVGDLAEQPLGGISPQLRYQPISPIDEELLRRRVEEALNPITVGDNDVVRTVTEPLPTAANERQTQADGATRQVTQTLQPGQDLYTDLLRRAEQLQLGGQVETPSLTGQPVRPGLPGQEPLAPTPPAEEPAGQTPPTDAVPPTVVQPPSFEGVIKPPSLTPGEPPAAVLPGDDESDDGDETPLPQLTMTRATPAEAVDLAVRMDSFASARPTQANAAIARAEQLMRQGRYYDATRELLRARRWDPGNPLIPLRISHAHLAAGEFYSAAVQLQQAVATFPSAVSIRTDLAELFGPDGRKILDDRLATLQRFASGSKQPLLWTLLSYVQQVSGQHEQARRSAARLLELPGLNSADRAVANFVLDRPTTQPQR